MTVVVACGRLYLEGGGPIDLLLLLLLRLELDLALHVFGERREA